MSKFPEVKVTLDLRNPALEEEDLEKLTSLLRKEMLAIDEVIDANHVLDPQPPAGSKAFGAILIGLISAKISAENIKALFGFLSDRLGGKQITMEVEANGKKLKVSASSQQELLLAIEAAQQFVTTA